MKPTDPEFLQLKKSILNLHDVFLNASLQRSYMLKTPIVTNPAEFHISDRARFERTWVFFLFVLYEAWNSKNSKILRKRLKIEFDEKNLDLFRKFKCSGLIKEMEYTRNYMAHRDKKDYFDIGRNSFYTRLKELNAFNELFSDILLFSLNLIKTNQ